MGRLHSPLEEGEGVFKGIENVRDNQLTFIHALFGKSHLLAISGFD